MPALPRGGLIGAFLMACVMVGVMGATIGHSRPTAARCSPRRSRFRSRSSRPDGKAEQGTVTFGRIRAGISEDIAKVVRRRSPALAARSACVLRGPRYIARHPSRGLRPWSPWAIRWRRPARPELTGPRRLNRRIHMALPDFSHAPAAGSWRPFRPSGPPLEPEDGRVTSSASATTSTSSTWRRPCRCCTARCRRSATRSPRAAASCSSAPSGRRRTPSPTPPSARPSTTSTRAGSAAR